MKKIAIVGISKVDPFDEREITDTIRKLILSYDEKEYAILSGGAHGIDSIAIATAKRLNYETFEIRPSGNTWEEYRARNFAIACECDELYCITTKPKTKWCYHHTPHQDHQKTAGCWTMNQALQQNKPCKLIVVET